MYSLDGFNGLDGLDSLNTFIIILIVILVLIYLGQKAFFSESFNSSDNPKQLKLLVFVSKSCPACHAYLNNHHDDVCALAKSMGVEVEKIQSDGSAKSNELFSKYNVQFIPTGIVLKGNKVHKNLGSNISPQTVKAALEK